MRKLLFVLTLLIAVSAVAETLHDHGGAQETPCPAVCLGGPGSACAEAAAARLPAPEGGEKPAAGPFINDFVPQVLEEEIFHPPAV